MSPYGYYIQDGQAAVDENKRKKIYRMYREYLKGSSIKESAEIADIPYSIARNALSNTVYLGNDFYPVLMEEELFFRVQRERESRNRYKEGNNRYRRKVLRVKRKFRVQEDFFKDKPLSADRMAERLYESIEPGHDEIMGGDTAREILKYVEELKNKI